MKSEYFEIMIHSWCDLDRSIYSSSFCRRRIVIEKSRLIHFTYYNLRQKEEEE